MDDHSSALTIFKVALTLTTLVNYFVLKRVIKGDGKSSFKERVFDVSSEEVVWSFISSGVGGSVYFLIGGAGLLTGFFAVCLAAWFLITKFLLNLSVDESVSVMIWSSFGTTVMWLSFVPFLMGK